MRCLPPSSSSHPTTLRLPLLISQREGRARPSPRKAHREAFPRWWGGVSIFTSAPAVETPSSCPRGGRGATRQAVPRLPRSEQLREPGFRGESPDPQTPRQALPLRHELLGWAPPRRVPGGGDQDVACLCAARPLATQSSGSSPPPAVPVPARLVIARFPCSIQRWPVLGPRREGRLPASDPGHGAGTARAAGRSAPSRSLGSAQTRPLAHGAVRSPPNPGPAWGVGGVCLGGVGLGEPTPSPARNCHFPPEWSCVVIKLNATRLTRSLACLCRSPGFHGCLGGTCSLLGAREGVAGELQRRFRPGLSGRHPTRPHPRCPEGTHADRAPDHTRCMSPAQPPAKAPAVCPAPQLRASRPYVLPKEEPRTRVSSREKLIRF